MCKYQSNPLFPWYNILISLGYASTYLIVGIDMKTNSYLIIRRNFMDSVAILWRTVTKKYKHIKVLFHSDVNTAMCKILTVIIMLYECLCIGSTFIGCTSHYCESWYITKYLLYGFKSKSLFSWHFLLLTMIHLVQCCN